MSYESELEDRLEMISAMELYGGSFVKALALCFVKADASNLQRLYTAFPEYVSEYHSIAMELKRTTHREVK